MMNEIAKDILLIELRKLEEEIKAIPEEKLWKTTEGVSNSCGNLCLHLCGNLQHYLGATLGKTGYVRNRDAEFSTKNLPKDKLLYEIALTKDAVSKALSALTENNLKQIYVQTFLGKEVTTEYYLVHTISHFDYHLGQINYLRRIL